jgi:hypothetical protein
LRDLLRKCEEVVAVLDDITRELDNMEARLRRCSWRLASLKDEAMKVEEDEGVSLRKARLDKASDMLSRASAKLLKLSEMIDKACFEVRVFVIEGMRKPELRREQSGSR